ncbi:ceramidase family protein [Cutaneotrichosporon oleaginosum]|uniref:Neutral ceramidase n=1 Tax=Cutaneotrichosporon oleaginosum TaxID=879819 RepID=A0A0J0XGF9_9TREE|nr:ceramidase family protein [Cutaneotrichosporon oleaginosum]KLT40146.1 ceramidase family protein [Cutaneotrichosporon oleaginosum]TXT06888.1 hypothetical protein COLE_06219 [Cutaneotrichosporon oleaginosum]
MFWLLHLALLVVTWAAGDTYLIGAGRGDITGPVVEVPFHGYASLDQKGTGLRQRIYARSFIVGDVNKPADRFLYIVLDTIAGDTAIRRGVIEALQSLGGEYALYTSNNVALVGTHSHSGPGGWHNYVLTQVPALGFTKQSYQAIVDGTVLSVKRAHESLTPGTLAVGTAKVHDGAINRSLWAFLANPEAERAQYADTTDTTMTLLRLKRADGKIQGILNWYAVHGTSAHNTNTHVTGDNKGVAAYLFEKEFGASTEAAPGFVAGFSQSNVGDTSPNVLGQWCTDGSGECSLETSTCADGKSTSCHGRGPMWEKNDHGIASAFEIGRRQYAAAKNIMDSIDSGMPVTGPSVKAFHFFKDMRYFSFTRPDGTQGVTCPAALGDSFAAGTTDGPGVGDFAQTVKANPFWKFVGGILKTPSPRQKACQGVKRILLDVGEMEAPFAWTANIVDIQVLRVGQLVIIVSSPEASTMAGRRWRSAIGEAAKSFLPAGVQPIVVLGGPANTYTHYAVTPEEYDVQRYEGSSTLYGRDTLNAYINLTVGAMSYLSPAASSVPPSGPAPPDNRGKSASFVTAVVYDNAPIGKKMGQVLSQPLATYARGATVKTVFQGANPRNNLRLEGTFAAVEMRGDDGSWQRVRDDFDWHLVYSWRRTDVIWGASTVQIDWETVDNPEPGTYRIKYYGDQKKPFTGSIEDFEGTSNEFTLT